MTQDISQLPPELVRTARWMMEENQTREFFVEYADVETRKTYGIIVLPAAEVDPARIIGYYGRREQTITAPMEIQRGHKIVTLRASAQKPIHCVTYLYPMCIPLNETALPGQSCWPFKTSEELQ